MGFVLRQAVAEQAPKVDFLRPRLLLDLLRHHVERDGVYLALLWEVQHDQQQS